MLKCDEREIQTSCWNKAAEKERIFVLLARDVTAPWTLRFWCLLRVLRRKNKWRDPQIQEALQCARYMIEQHNYKPWKNAKS